MKQTWTWGTWFNGVGRGTCSFVSLGLAAETQTPSTSSQSVFSSPYEMWIHHISSNFDSIFNWYR